MESSESKQKIEEERERKTTSVKMFQRVFTNVYTNRSCVELETEVTNLDFKR